MQKNNDSAMLGAQRPSNQGYPTDHVKLPGNKCQAKLSGAGRQAGIAALSQANTSPNR